MPSKKNIVAYNLSDNMLISRKPEMQQIYDSSQFQ